MKERERIVCVTMLLRRASARCCVPLSPILFSLSHILVSVCEKSGRGIFDEGKRDSGMCYRVTLKSVSEMFCSFVANFVLREIQFFESLCEIRKRDIR
jgi:hypothetical protein